MQDYNANSGFQWQAVMFTDKEIIDYALCVICGWWMDISNAEFPTDPEQAVIKANLNLPAFCNLIPALISSSSDFREHINVRLYLDRVT